MGNLRFTQWKTIIFCDNLYIIYLTRIMYNIVEQIISILDIISFILEYIEVKHIDTKNNSTNVFTKSVPMSKLIHCLDLLNIYC